MDLDVFSYTSPGGRAENEDSISSVYDRGRGLFLVADGLGGHACGALASGIAAETVQKEFDFSAAPDAQAAQAELRRVLAAANQRIMAQQAVSRRVMKTTAAVLAMTEHWAAWAHVGDSRLYALHDGEIMFCTADHSVAYKKYRGGEITREQIGSDPDQCSLLRSLGGRERCEPDTACGAEAPVCGDGFLLCTDGLWTYLRDAELRHDFCETSSAQAWAELLLRRVTARALPGQDNLSLIAVRVHAGSARCRNGAC